LEIRICAIFLSFIYYVLPLEIQISRAEGWYPINWFFFVPVPGLGFPTSYHMSWSFFVFGELI